MEKSASSNNEEEYARHPQTERRNDRQSDDSIKGIKLKIPSFQGRSDPETYLEWERKIEMIFQCYNYKDEQKVKLAAVEFTDYASVWQDQLRLSRRKNREQTVETLEELQGLM